MGMARNAVLATLSICLMLELCRGFFLGGSNRRLNCIVYHSSWLDQNRRGTPSSHPVLSSTALFGRKKTIIDNNTPIPEPASSSKKLNTNADSERISKEISAESKQTKSVKKAASTTSKLNIQEKLDELENFDDLDDILDFSGGSSKDSTGKDNKDLELDLDLEELEKISAMFPPDVVDDENEEGLAEALRGIENGDFDIDQFFKDGADMLGEVDMGLAGGNLAMDDDILGDIDLFAEIGAAVTGSPDSNDRRDKSSKKGSFSDMDEILGGSAQPDVMAAGLSVIESEVRPREPASSNPFTPLTPLEEFKRLMESLGPNSFMDDDLLFGISDEPEIDEALILSGKQIRNTWDKDNVVVEMREVEGLGECEFRDGELWQGGEIPDGPLLPRVLPEEDPYNDVYAPNYYEGGKMRSNFEKFKIDPKTINEAQNFSMYLHTIEQDERIEARVRIISVLTTSETNSTALDIVNKVYDYIKAGTEQDKDKIEYEIHCYQIETEPGSERGEVRRSQSF